MWYKDKSWWQAAAERAIRSIAQGLLVGIGECAVIQAVDWKLAIGTGALMGVVSILTSVAFGLPEYVEKKEEENGSD